MSSETLRHILVRDICLDVICSTDRYEVRLETCLPSKYEQNSTKKVTEMTTICHLVTSHSYPNDIFIQ